MVVFVAQVERHTLQRPRQLYLPRVMFRVQGSGSGFRVQGSGFRVQCLGFRFQVSGFRVQGSGFRVQDLGLRVEG